MTCTGCTRAMEAAVKQMNFDDLQPTPYVPCSTYDLKQEIINLEMLQSEGRIIHRIMFERNKNLKTNDPYDDKARQMGYEYYQDYKKAMEELDNLIPCLLN